MIQCVVCGKQLTIEIGGKERVPTNFDKWERTDKMCNECYEHWNRAVRKEP